MKSLAEWLQKPANKLRVSSSSQGLSKQEFGPALASYVVMFYFG